MSRARELLAALLHANAGGLVAHPPGIGGDPGLGLPGVHGVPRARRWDAVVSSAAPDLPGEATAFVVLADGTIVVDEDLPDGALAPLADAVEELLAPPYRAAAVRHDGRTWSVVAESILVLEIRRLEGDSVDLTVVDGVRDLKVDDEPTIRPIRALDEVAAASGDVVLHAERIDGDLFALDVLRL